jgi:hypothetical protein
LVADHLPNAGSGRENSNQIKNAVSANTPWGEDASRSPKQLIFLSIDAIDSTRLKSSPEQSGTSGLWAQSLASFLSEVAVVYRNKLADVINKHCPDNCPRKKEHRLEASTHKVNVWKYIGDEVVLMAKLTCEKHHASLHVLALAETIKEFNSVFSKYYENKSEKLRFKGTAWVAGFPVRNIELELPGPDVEKVNDFLGPSMDLGFRLSKVASDDRLIISASLAYLIMKDVSMNKPIELKKRKCHRLPLCFGGLAEFKGIKNNKHPLIWYSVNETDESGLCNVEYDELQGFLQDNFFIDPDNPPFIPGADPVSQEYMEKYNKATEEQKSIPGTPFYQKGQNFTSFAKEGVKSDSLDFNQIVKRLPPPPPP